MGLKDEFLERVFNYYCKSKDTQLYGDVLKKQMRQLPHGLSDEEVFDIEMPVYFYNPDNLPGLAEVENTGSVYCAGSLYFK